MKAAVFILHLYCICAYVRADACQPDDCRGGDCELTRLPNGSIQKSCHCVKGVCGDTCQRLCNATSQCTANPCWFGGTCIDVANLDYICLCPPNHTGKDCRTLIACEPTSCQNGGTCVQSAYGAQCSCPANFRGDFCQYTTIAKPTKKVPVAEYRQFDDDTISAIAGLGSSSTSEQSYNQRMFAIAMGNRSQFVFCLTNPCENGGSCFITNSATTKGICICHEGYIGDYCEIVRNKTSNGIRLHNGFCATNPCQHDGTCVEVGLIDGYCRCSPQYRGPNCEIIVRSFGCHPNPCKNGGTCVMLENNQAQCLCTPVFRGITCNQFSYVPCGDATCHGSQGMCISNKCVCKQGFAGPRCDSTDFCSAYPCLNGGTCIQTNDEPYGGCSCPPEFSGPTCSNDPCNPSPCLNGGQCIRKPDNQFYCQCRNKNRGIYCEQADCFPADATVDVQGVGKVELSSLKIGQEVRIIDDQDQLSYSPVIAFLHRDLNEEGSYVRLRTKTALIELSPRHLIHSRSSGFVWAEKLSKGDEILVVSSKRPNETHWEAIVEIRDVEKPGLMAPLTEQGTIVVNNVHASCYALVRSHSIGHLALAPYRWYRRAFGRSSDGAVSTPILNYANILLHFFKNLPIVRDLIF